MPRDVDVLYLGYSQVHHWVSHKVFRFDFVRCVNRGGPCCVNYWKHKVILEYEWRNEFNLTDESQVNKYGDGVLVYGVCVCSNLVNQSWSLGWVQGLDLDTSFVGVFSQQSNVIKRHCQCRKQGDGSKLSSFYGYNWDFNFNPQIFFYQLDGCTYKWKHWLKTVIKFKVDKYVYLFLYIYMFIMSNMWNIICLLAINVDLFQLLGGALQFFCWLSRQQIGDGMWGQTWLRSLMPGSLLKNWNFPIGNCNGKPNGNMAIG